jgi:hypothetical protein
VVAVAIDGAPGVQPESESVPDTASLQSWGWSSRPDASRAKIAALAALAQLPEPGPVACVSYTSRGNLLVIGGHANARAAAEALAPILAVTLLDSSAGPGAGPYAIWHGKLAAIEGWFGAA